MGNRQVQKPQNEEPPNPKLDNNDDEDGINRLVDSILKDEGLNLRFVPDVIERRIYRNLLRFVIAAIKRFLTTVSVQFIGQEIRLVVSPVVTAAGDN